MFKKIAEVVLTLILFAIGGVLLATALESQDDTDSPYQRSGMRLFTDHGTGCQYLGSMRGPFTPRLDAAGKQVGCR